MEVERKLVSTKFATYGSLYYRGTHSQTECIINRGSSATINTKIILKLGFGLTTERSFWETKKKELDID